VWAYSKNAKEILPAGSMPLSPSYVSTITGGEGVVKTTGFWVWGKGKYLGTLDGVNQRTELGGGAHCPLWRKDRQCSTQKKDRPKTRVGKEFRAMTGTKKGKTNESEGVGDLLRNSYSRSLGILVLKKKMSQNPGVIEKSYEEPLA